VDNVALPAFFAQLDGVPSGYSDATAAAPSSVSVRVVNGTGTAGLASSAGSALTRLGFRVAGTSNAANPTSLTTVTYPKGMEAQAKAVADRVPGAVVARVADAQQVTLTLGTDGAKVASGSGSGSTGSTRSTSAPAPAPAPASPPVKSYSATSCIN
jgi:hypothetical protein